jgi:hypothetical protein
MARFSDLARERTDLSEPDIDRLRALAADWTLLSDTAFADLVLWLPTWHGAGFVAADQVRPTTGPTGMFDDIVGEYAARGRVPARPRGGAAGRGRPRVAPARRGDPVVHDGRLIAVSSATPPSRGRSARLRGVPEAADEPGHDRRGSCLRTVGAPDPAARR